MLQVPKAILDSIEGLYLPSMPQVLLRFLQLSSDDNTSMDELATLVGHDPALSARILAVANSPALLRGAETKNLLQCLVNLGTRLARTLAACLVVQRAFSPIEDNQHYDLTGFWGHSLRVAEVARAVAGEVDYPDPEEAYLSGLLHDIGQLLLLGGVGERYGSMLVLSRDESDLRDIEEQRLGTDHATVGAWLVEQWKLSSFMSDSILFHHARAEKILAADSLSRIVWAAHVICYRHKQLDELHDETLTDLAMVNRMTGVAAPRLLQIYSQCCQRVVAVAAALGISENADAKTLPQTSSLPLVNFSPGHDQVDPAAMLIEEAVRDMAIMQPLQQGLASLDGEDEILLAVRESARILFGSGPAFLLYQPGRDTLSVANVASQPGLLLKLEVPLEPGYSLAVTACQENRPCCTLEQPESADVSLSDLQLSRLLGSEGVLFVPLKARKSCLGVLAFGVNGAQAARLRQRVRWMTGFAGMAAASIENWRDIKAREADLEAAMTRQFERHARKVVHEAGNPLGIIRNYLEIVNRKLPEDNELLPELEILGEEIDRVTEIIRKMSDLTEIPPEAGVLDINKTIENMLVLYGEALFSARGIAIEKDFDPALPAIAVERDSLKQILLNLWNNASQAMPGGGSIVLSTNSNLNQNGRAYVEVRVSDAGPGLPSDVIERLFQPLGSDRNPGRSGVGLSIVAGLVARLDGSITCQSKAGLGTSYSILLPRARKEG